MADALRTFGLVELRDRLRRDVSNCARECDAKDLARYADAVDAAIALKARLALAEEVCEAWLRYDEEGLFGQASRLGIAAREYKQAREADEAKEKD